MITMGVIFPIMITLLISIGMIELTLRMVLQKCLHLENILLLIVFLVEL